MNTNHTPEPLQFADAVRIAKGCTDYGGGYRGDAALAEAYQSGIATVINSLQSAARTGFNDSQVRALHGIGGGQEKLRAAAPLLLDALRQWAAAERDGDAAELENARAARDAAIAAATN